VSEEIVINIGFLFKFFTTNPQNFFSNSIYYNYIVHYYCITFTYL